MLKMFLAFRIRRAVAAALSLQLAAIFGLSAVEASHNHLDPHAAQWSGDAEDHQGDGQSAHAPCILCGHAGTGLLVANRARVVLAPPVHGVRAHPRPSSRLVAVDTGFSIQSRAPPGHLIPS